MIDWLDGQKLFDVHVHVHGRNQNKNFILVGRSGLFFILFLFNKNKIKNKPDRPTLVRMSEVTRNNELILGGLMRIF